MITWIQRVALVAAILAPAGAVAQLPPPPVNMCLATFGTMTASQAMWSPKWTWINWSQNLGAWTWTFNTTLLWSCGDGDFDQCQECLRMTVAYDSGPGPPAVAKWVVMPNAVVNGSPAVPAMAGCGTHNTSTTGWSYWFPVDQGGFGGWQGLKLPKGTRMQAIFQVADFNPADGPGCLSQDWKDQKTVPFTAR